MNKTVCQQNSMLTCYLKILDYLLMLVVSDEQCILLLPEQSLLPEKSTTTNVVMDRNLPLHIYSLN